MFFGTWNLISDVINYRNCLAAKVKFEYSESRYAGGGDVHYIYGYLKDRKVYLNERFDDSFIDKDTTLEVWCIPKDGDLYARLKLSGESAREFRYRIVFKYFIHMAIWLGIYFTLHVITLIVKKNVHLEVPKKNNNNELYS